MPLMKPSTTFRASSSRLLIRASTFGSTNRAPGRMECSISRPKLHAALRHRHGVEQLVDDAIGGHTLRLRVEVREHAVAEHRMGEGADVLEADVEAAVGE